MTSAAEMPMRYMLDTNCFNRILDGQIRLCIPDGVTLICTGVQKDELGRCKRPERSEALLNVFEQIDPSIELAASFCFDIEGAGFGQAHWNDGSGRFSRMLARLQDLDLQTKKKPKDPRNQIRDIVNAETALKGGLIFVTTDENLEKVFIEFGGSALKFQDFITRMDTR